MATKDEYQYKKLNELLNTSFNNVKYDIRSLNERVETLKNQMARLSADSVYKALEEQNKVIFEQQRSINKLMTRLEGLEGLRAEAAKASAKVEVLARQTRVDTKDLLREAIAVKKAETATTKKASKYSKIKKGEVKITKVQFKAPRNGKTNLNGEWVEITGYDVDMTGYKLHDAKRKHVFKFPKGFTIYGPVKIFTGKGKNTNTRLYWNNPRPIWNDNTDVATLKDNKNKIVSRVKSEVTYTFDILK